MTKFINWCLSNENIFICFFSFVTVVLLSLVVLAFSFVLIVTYPLLGIPAFFGVYYLIYLKYKGEQT